MKTFVLAFLAAYAPVLAQTNYGTITFTNKSGEVTSNAVVTKVDGSKLFYRYSAGGGGGTVRLADLPGGLQARFGYIPDGGDNTATLQRPAQPTDADIKKFEEIKAKAEKGDAQAQGDLGRCYALGEGVAKDAVEAVKWYRQAAERGNATGENGLGFCYLNGEGVTKDAVEAVKWYRKAAEQGFAKAQVNLGLCYLYGEGVTKDAVEAVKWFREAATQGFAKAQVNLGYCYRDGDGVTKDAVEAVKWFREAATQGFAYGQLNLGICYYKGNGVAKDPVEAVKWYRKAATQGLVHAQCFLSLCYRDGDGVAKDVVESVRWLRKAAEQGDAQAQGDLGRCYALGEGVTKDPVEAVKWYRKAAEQGDAQAHFALGYCYRDGEGVTKDPVEAAKWFRKAMAFIDTNGVEDDLHIRFAAKMVAEEGPASSSRPDVGVALGQDAITFTNKIVTFTNLQGRIYQDVQLTRADLVGIIYREGAGGGRVYYTNLPAAFLESLGISSNWIAAAEVRADRRGAANAAYEQRVQQDAVKQWAEKAQAKKLASLEVNVYGKVIQITGDGALIDVGPRDKVTLVLLSDYPKQLIDGEAVQVVSFQFDPRYDRDRPGSRLESSGLKAYVIGVYEYTDVRGAGRTVSHYTCSRAKAVAYAKTLQLQDAP